MVESVKLLVDQAVPCILHLEMQSSEKTIQMLFSKGIDQCGAKMASCQKFLDFGVYVTEVMNKKCLAGTDNQCTQWKFPKNDKEELGKVSFNNRKA